MHWKLLLFGILFLPFLAHGASVTLTHGIMDPSNQEWSIGTGKRDVTMLQLRIQIDESEHVDLESLQLEARGSGDESISIAGVRVAEDRDHNGKFDKYIDPIWSEEKFTIDDGILLLPIRKRLAAGTETDLLILYGMGGDFRDGETFRFLLTNAQIRGVLSKEYISITYLPLSSMTLTTIDTNTTCSKDCDPLGNSIFDDQYEIPSPVRFSLDPFRFLYHLLPVKWWTNK